MPYTAWFDPHRHHVGAVTVLGRTFANASADGRAEIRAFLAAGVDAIFSDSVPDAVAALTAQTAAPAR